MTEITRHFLLYVDSLQPAHIELTVYDMTTGRHSARLVGTWDSLSHYTAQGGESGARLCSRLATHAVWLVEIGVDGRRHPIPHRSGDGQWQELVRVLGYIIRGELVPDGLKVGM